MCIFVDGECERDKETGGGKEKKEKVDEDGEDGYGG